MKHQIFHFLQCVDILSVFANGRQYGLHSPEREMSFRQLATEANQWATRSKIGRPYGDLGDSVTRFAGCGYLLFGI